MQYNLCIVSPEGYIHSAAFAELAELVAFGLRDLGHAAVININRTFGDARNILIGCHLLNPTHMHELPKDSVVLNTEQLARENNAWTDNVCRWASGFETWDYSERNLECLRSICAQPPRLLRIGYHAQLARINRHQEKDIDVLFYGSVGARRQHVIDALRATGLRVEVLFGVYGRERDAVIARSRVVLNMHHYYSQIFEVVRVFYLMTNAKAVVSEVGDNTAIADCYAGGIQPAAYADLADSCVRLVAHEARRRELEAQALDTIMKLPQHEVMRELVG